MGVRTPSPMSRQSLLTDAVAIGAAQVILGIKSFLVIGLVTRQFGVSVYGLWAEARAAGALLANILGLGLAYALVRFLSGNRDRNVDRQSVSTSIVLVGGAVAGTLFIYAPFHDDLSAHLFEGEAVFSLAVLFLGGSTAINRTLLGFVRAKHALTRYSLWLLAIEIPDLIVFLATVWHNISVRAAIIAIVSTHVLMTAVLLTAVSWEVRLARPTFAAAGRLLRFGLPTVPSNAGAWVVRVCDRLIIGYLVNAQAAGTYASAYALGSIPDYVSRMTAFALPRHFFRASDQGAEQEALEATRTAVTVTVAAGAPAIVILGAFGDVILEILATVEVARQAPFIPLVIAVATTLYGIYAALLPRAVEEHGTRFLAALWLLSAVFNASLNFALIPLMSEFGAAISTLLSYTIVVLVIIRRARVSLFTTIYWPTVAVTTGSAVLAVGALRALQFSSWRSVAVNLIIVVGGGILVGKGARVWRYRLDNDG